MSFLLKRKCSVAITRDHCFWFSRGKRTIQPFVFTSEALSLFLYEKRIFLIVAGFVNQIIMVIFLSRTGKSIKPIKNSCLAFLSKPSEYPNENIY